MSDRFRWGWNRYGYHTSGEQFVGKDYFIGTERIRFEEYFPVCEGEGNLFQAPAGTVEGVELFRRTVPFQGELCDSPAGEDRSVAFLQENLHFFRGEFRFFDFGIGQMEQENPVGIRQLALVDCDGGSNWRFSCSHNRILIG